MEHLANGICRRLGRLMSAADPAPDGELLTRFVEGRDAEAFAVLVRRHGPMVRGVCRRVLGNHADADDAFQATFLVLARRARAVRPRALLGNWLYGVAYRTSLEARRAAAVRRARERSAAEMRPTATPADGPPPDLREVLDREIEALPAAYRAAVVLCDLEGLSRRDAARRLGWREGTLSGRLARARSLLAARLARHGLALPAAGLGVAGGAAAAAVPAALAESTTRIGVLLAAGEAAAVAPAPVAALTEGVMKAMLLTKLKGMAMTAVVGCAVLATAVGGWQANATGAGEPQVDRAKAAAAQRNPARDPDKDRIAELERERDRLLKVISELENRLARLEAAPRDRADDTARDLLEVARNRARVEEERARAARAAAAKGAGEDPRADLAERLKALEAQRARDDGRRPADRAAAADLLRKIEAERAKAAAAAKDAAADPAAKVRRAEDDRVRGADRRPAGDRTAALEERLNQLADEMKRLRLEVEQLRKK